MKKDTQFPDLSGEYLESLAESTIELNGHKVLFDKKVSLMPVKLDNQSKEKIK